MRKSLQLILFIALTHFINAWAHDEKVSRDRARDLHAGLSDPSRNLGTHTQCNPAKIQELAEALASENCSDANEVHLRRAERLLCNSAS